MKNKKPLYKFRGEDVIPYASWIKYCKRNPDSLIDDESGLVQFTRSLRKAALFGYNFVLLNPLTVGVGIYYLTQKID
ncbi:MAG: hypothetical protein ABIA78_01010 [archaeon]